MFLSKILKSLKPVRSKCIPIGKNQKIIEKKKLCYDFLRQNERVTNRYTSIEKQLM